MSRSIWRAGAILASCALAVGFAAAAFPASPTGDVYATVDGAVISTDEFAATLANAVRQKFYHRQPSEEQLAALKQDLTDRLVNRMLLLKEAQRRGIKPEEKKVRAEIAAYDERYRNRPQWSENRSRVLSALSEALREQSVIAQLESAARVARASSETELRAYYSAHPDRFTEPERVRLSMIMRKVDPSSPAAAWEEALEELRGMVTQLQNGADFAELARLRSDDSSAHAGGDLGYRHRGMLPPGIETEIDKLDPGATSQPFRLLEGIAVFRVIARQSARLRNFAEVRANIAELWSRDEGEAQWRELLARLRARAEIKISRNGAPASGNESKTFGGRTAR
ncbi:MAG: peptidylprolyl isomerase [Betaproteobacteria bacterium]